jgi:hypothetical protein
MSNFSHFPDKLPHPKPNSELEDTVNEFANLQDINEAPHDFSINNSSNNIIVHPLSNSMNSYCELTKEETSLHLFSEETKISQLQHAQISEKNLQSKRSFRTYVSSQLTNESIVHLKDNQIMKESALKAESSIKLVINNCNGIHSSLEKNLGPNIGEVIIVSCDKLENLDGLIQNPSLKALSVIDSPNIVTELLTLTSTAINNLELLCLEKCNLTDDHLELLFQHFHFVGLKRLILRNNRFTSNAFIKLNELNNLTSSLLELDISSCYINLNELSPLFQNLKFKGLKMLDLGFQFKVMGAAEEAGFKLDFENYLRNQDTSSPRIELINISGNCKKNLNHVGVLCDTLFSLSTKKYRKLLSKAKTVYESKSNGVSDSDFGDVFDSVLCKYKRINHIKWLKFHRNPAFKYLLDNDAADYMLYLKNKMKENVPVTDVLANLRIVPNLLQTVNYDGVCNAKWATTSFKDQIEGLLSLLEKEGYIVFCNDKTPNNLEYRLVNLVKIDSKVADLSLCETIIEADLKDEILTIKQSLSTDFYASNRSEKLSPDNIDHLVIILSWFNEKTDSFNFAIENDATPEVIMKTAIVYMKNLNLVKETVALIEEAKLIKLKFAAEFVFDRDFNNITDDLMVFAKRFWKSFKHSRNELRSLPLYLKLQQEEPIHL